MNTLYFYTDSIRCEHSSLAFGCTEFKQLLNDNLWPYTLIDLYKNTVGIQELRLIIGNTVNLPQFIIKNNFNSIITHFSSLDIIQQTQIRFENFNYSKNNVNLNYIQLILEEALRNYQVI